MSKDFETVEVTGLYSEQLHYMTRNLMVYLGYVDNRIETSTIWRKEDCKPFFFETFHLTQSVTAVYQLLENEGINKIVTEFKQLPFGETVYIMLGFYKNKNHRFEWSRDFTNNPPRGDALCVCLLGCLCEVMAAREKEQTK